MGKFGRLSRAAKFGEQEARDASRVEPAVTDIARGQTPGEIVRNSANVLEQGGEADFQRGGKFNKLKDFAQNSMSRRSYNQQMQQQIGMGGGPGIEQLMMNQLGGVGADMAATGAVSAGMGKLGMMGTVMKGVEIVKDGTKVVTSLAKGDFHSMAQAAGELKNDFQSNGVNSMVDSVGMLHNAGMLNQVTPQAWQGMAGIDNGTMTQRMGFNPAMAAQNPMIAQNAMMSQFAPGSGVPAGWGEPPKSGIASFAKKAAVVGGLALAGHELIQHHEGVEKGLSSFLNPDAKDSSDDAKAVGGAAKDVGGLVKDAASPVLGALGDDAKILGGGALDLGAKVTGLDALGHKLEGGFEHGVSGLDKAATGQSADFSSKESNNPYAPPKDEGPSL